jgi:putative two-component system response regulator
MQKDNLREEDLKFLQEALGFCGAGVCSVEIHKKTKQCRLYLSPQLVEMLGMGGIEDPAECYQYWREGLHHSSNLDMSTVLERVLVNEKLEVSCYWGHTEEQKVFLKIILAQDKVEEDIIFVRGCIQNLTKLIHEETDYHQNKEDNLEVVQRDVQSEEPCLEERRSLLIVDDEEVNRVILSLIFEDQYDIIEAENGEEAIEMFEKHKDTVSAILLDIIMPVMDGYGVIQYMVEKDYISKTPIILITGENSVDVLQNVYRMGVSDVINKPFDNDLVSVRVSNVVELYYHKNHLEDLVEKQTKQLREQNARIVNTLGTVVEFRNMETGTHILKVKEFTRIMAKAVAKAYPEYGLTPKAVQLIVEASPLHDVGKISISDTILLKPGKLTKEEFDIMKTHSTKGAEIIRYIIDEDLPSELLKYCEEIALSHHEKFDGSGYPNGLVGEDIPISAQIVSVADVYDALTSERCYKKAFSKEQAYNMILNGECGQFNPKLMECFKQVRPIMEKVVDEHRSVADVNDQ